MVERQRGGTGRYVVRSVGTLGCALLAFYALPLRVPRDPHQAVGVLLFAAGLTGLTWLIVHQVRHFVGRPGEARVRFAGLLSVLYLVVIFFALSYYLLERVDAAQFDGLATRTDALYFSIVTLGTVGYGDVFAVGQAARVAAMVQITFDLIVIGALLAVASAQLAHRLAVVRAEQERAEQDRPEQDRGDSGPPR